MTTLQDAGTPELPASTPCADAPPLRIHPRLREYGEATPRGALPRVRPWAQPRARHEALSARPAVAQRLVPLADWTRPMQTLANHRTTE